MEFTLTATHESGSKITLVRDMNDNRTLNLLRESGYVKVEWTNGKWGGTWYFPNSKGECTYGVA